MAECPSFDHLLLIPRLRVQNANAISAPLTHGFPSITAFLGLMWALERKTQAAGLELQFNAVGVAVHDFEEQVTDGGFVSTFRLTRNPVEKDGGTAAIVEEGRIHLDLSLIFAVKGAALAETQAAEQIASRVRELLCEMRIAGGSVVSSAVSHRRQRPYVVAQTGNDQGRYELFKKLRRQLLPGFVLVERPDLLEQRLQSLADENPAASRLDAWLSLARINYRSQATDGEWSNDRKNLGWIVPMPLGYGALGELHAPGSVANTRDNSVPFNFVESLYGIGEWLSPHRLSHAEQMLWYADSRPNEGIYRCRNDYRSTPVYDFD
jgi:CRISPR-associated protein Csy2